MTIKMKIDGFRELERALLDLPRGTSIGVARRVMKKQLTPVQKMADDLWPGANEAYMISSRVSRRQQPQSLAKFERGVVNMFIGSHEPHAHLVEFGTGPRYTRNGSYRGAMSPMPSLQPAWDAHRRKILAGLGADLWAEIEKTVARRARRAAKKAGR